MQNESLGRMCNKAFGYKAIDVSFYRWLIVRYIYDRRRERKPCDYYGYRVFR